MGFLDFFEKIGELILGFKSKEFSEEDNIIKAIYVALKKAEDNLKMYNEAIFETRKLKPNEEGKIISSPKDIHKELREVKLQNKVAVLSQLKKDINDILREF